MPVRFDNIYDVVVAGGGNAALCAAITAARSSAFAAGALKSRRAQLAKWCQLARDAGTPPFPVTAHAAEALVGALREAGYHTANAIRAKQEHIARGHAWADALALAFKNLEVGCKRVSNLAVRPPSSLWPNRRAASTD